MRLITLKASSFFLSLLHSADTENGTLEMFLGSGNFALCHHVVLSLSSNYCTIMHHVVMIYRSTLTAFVNLFRCLFQLPFLVFPSPPPPPSKNGIVSVDFESVWGGGLLRDTPFCYPSLPFTRQKVFFYLSLLISSWTITDYGQATWILLFCGLRNIELTEMNISRMVFKGRINSHYDFFSS